MKVCVLGAGVSGLVAVKELLEEGHSVVCFEKRPSFGGIFGRFTEFEGVYVYDSTQLTISNYFMAYSSLTPERDEERDYWSHQEYFNYIKRFVQKFNLEPSIQYSTEIVSIDPSSSGVSVTVETSAGERRTEEFDAIAICHGVHQVPNILDIPGTEEFTGEIHHSYLYQNAEPYRDKKVLCVGLGETGADVTYEISAVAETCHISVRGHPAIVERYPIEGLTNDVFTTRCFGSFPKWLLNLEERIQYGLVKYSTSDPIKKTLASWVLDCPNFHGKFLTKNERFIHAIVEHKAKPNTSGLARLGPDYAEYCDGTKVEIDTIVLNTGYVESFPKVGDVEVKNSRQLYRHMFHPELGSRVAFIGFARPQQGGLPALSEMQSRVFAKICSGSLTLPAADKLSAQIASENAAESRRFTRSPSLNSLVLYGDYIDGLAKLIGAKPNWRDLIKDPKLAYRVFMGSWLAAQYRLSGPGSNYKEARELIMRLPVGYPIAVIPLFFTVGIVCSLLKKSPYNAYALESSNQ